MSKKWTPGKFLKCGLNGEPDQTSLNKQIGTSFLEIQKKHGRNKPKNALDV